MKEFDTIAGINVTGVYPDAVATNDSVAGAFDGTQMFADWLNEHFGWIQDVMERAALTPSGTPDANGASQITQAIRLSKGMPGEVMLHMGQTDPASLSDPARVLMLNGQGILRANYAELDTATYVGDGNNFTADSFFRADNANGTGRNVSGIYLILADARGSFLRAIDDSAAIDPGGTRLAGDSQAHGMATHRHLLPLYGASNILSIYSVSGLPGDITAENFTGSGTELSLSGASSTGGISNSLTSGGRIEGYNGTPDVTGDEVGETRPLNTACHFAIWY